MSRSRLINRSTAGARRSCSCIRASASPAKRVDRPSLTSKQAEEFVGNYHSGELGVIYTITRRDNRLMVRHPRGEYELRPVETGVFEANDPIGKVTFTAARGAGSRASRSTGRGSSALRFDRVELKPAE